LKLVAQSLAGCTNFLLINPLSDDTHWMLQVSAVAASAACPS
jgi:hypothetical protein